MTTLQALSSPKFVILHAWIISAYCLLNLASAVEHQELGEHSVFNHPLKKSYAKSEFQAVIQRLQKQTIIQSDFEQSKFIHALTKPLISRGKVVVSKARGVYWKITSPFESEWILKPETMLYKADGNSQFETITAKERPMIGRFSKLFLSIIDSDSKELRKHFKLFFTQDRERWTLGLIPRKTPLKRIIKRVFIEGQVHIEKITLTDKNTDTTEILFTSISVDLLNIR